MEKLWQRKNPARSQPSHTIRFQVSRIKNISRLVCVSLLSKVNISADENTSLRTCRFPVFLSTLKNLPYIVVDSVHFPLCDKDTQIQKFVIFEIVSIICFLRNKCFSSSEALPDRCILSTSVDFPHIKISMHRIII